MKKIFYLIILLFVHQVAWGMLYQPKHRTLRPRPARPATIFLVPISGSEDLESLKAKGSSYEKIPLLRTIAEKSEYITDSHQASLGRLGSPYSASYENPDRLFDSEEIAVRTDYPDGLKALAQLYKQEYTGKPVTLGAKELSSLVKSDLIHYLQMPEPKEDVQKLLIQAIKTDPAGSVGSFYKLDDGVALDIDSVKDLIGDLVSELFSSYSKELAHNSTKIINTHVVEPRKTEDLVFFDGNVAIYGNAYISEEGHYRSFRIVDKKNQGKDIELNLDSFKKSDFYTLQMRTEGFLDRHLIEVPGLDPLSYVVIHAFRDWFNRRTISRHFLIDVNELSMFSLPVMSGHPCFAGANKLCFLDANRMIKSIDLVSKQEELIVDLSGYLLPEESFSARLLCDYKSEKPTILCATKKRIFIISQKNKKAEVHTLELFSNKDKCFIKGIKLSELGSKFLVWFYRHSAEGESCRVYDLDQGNLIQKDEFKIPEFTTCREAFFIGESESVIVCTKLDKEPMKVWLYRSHVLTSWDSPSSDVLFTPDGKNMILDTHGGEARFFPLYDDAMIKIIDYLDATNPLEGYSYNQRLDGILLLNALLKKDVPFQLNKTEQKIFDTCLPDEIKAAVKKIIQDKIDSSYRQSSENAASVPVLENVARQDDSSVKQNNNFQKTFLSSLKNYTHGMYSSLADKLSNYRKEIIFGASAIGSAMGLTAAYKYLSNKQGDALPGH